MFHSKKHLTTLKAFAILIPVQGCRMAEMTLGVKPFEPDADNADEGSIHNYCGQSQKTLFTSIFTKKEWGFKRKEGVLDK